jgi:2-polyprenyl-6-hydroxyphenyl methylase/3-demethylubiquinone-9 3-methyltransferase
MANDICFLEAISTMTYSKRWQIAQWFELRWWIRYLAPRQPQAYLTWKRSYWYSVVSRLTERPQGRMLDAGCGPAGMFIVLPRDATIHAIDPLLDEYNNNLLHFSTSQYPHIDFWPSTIEEWHDPEGYDTIMCMNALNHVDNLQAACRNLANHLRPGGRLLLTVDGHRSSFLKKVFRLIPGDLLHPHQLTLADYLSLLRSYGLQAEPIDKMRTGTIFDHYIVEATKLRTGQDEK